ncbi:MAG: MBL fold metallo-hydrolase [Clostridiales bacterium]|nr:MBL fold metallo-hydrolase [Clostridiales bacterium]
MIEIKKHELSDHIYRFAEKGNVSVDAYLVCGRERAVVIDGLHQAKGLYDMVRKITNKPVSLLLTHGHFDHAGTGFCEFLVAGCDCYVSCQDLPLLIEMYGEEFCQNPHLHNVKEGMHFDLGDDVLTVISMAGHTQGSMLFFLEEEKKLFTGDAIGSGALWMQLKESSPLIDYIKELRRLASFLSDQGTVSIYPGHSCQIVPYLQTGQDYLDIAYVNSLIQLTQDIIAGNVRGKEANMSAAMFTGIQILSASGPYITDYCYDGQHVTEAKDNH